MHVITVEQAIARKIPASQIINCAEWHNTTIKIRDNEIEKERHRIIRDELIRVAKELLKRNKKNV